MTVQVLANYLAVGTQDCLSKSNQIRVEPNWCTHVFAPRIGFTESACKDDYAVDLPKQERWNQFIRRGVAEKSSVEVKPTRKNLAYGSGIDGDGGERPTCLSKKSNSRFQQTLSLQVKLSKDFLYTMKPIFQEQERWVQPVPNLYPSTARNGSRPCFDRYFARIRRPNVTFVTSIPSQVITRTDHLRSRRFYA